MGCIFPVYPGEKIDRATRSIKALEAAMDDACLCLAAKKEGK